MIYELLGKKKEYFLYKIINIFDYIKIDVDGIEHLILMALCYLKDQKIITISKINENFNYNMIIF